MCFRHVAGPAPPAQSPPALLTTSQALSLSRDTAQQHSNRKIGPCTAQRHPRGWVRALREEGCDEGHDSLKNGGVSPRGPGQAGS